MHPLQGQEIIHDNGLHKNYGQMFQTGVFVTCTHFHDSVKVVSVAASPANFIPSNKLFLYRDLYLDLA